MKKQPYGQRKKYQFIANLYSKRIAPFISAAIKDIARFEDKALIES